MKTPEEYFQEHVAAPDEGGAGELSEAEAAFIKKYMGLKSKEALGGIRRYDPGEADSLPGFAAPPPQAPAAAASPEAAGPVESAEPEEDYEESLRRDPNLQLVGFKVDEQEFGVPITSIQEVIRYVEPTKLPAAPYFLEGIVNLRGRVTPLVNLRTLLSIGGDVTADKFIIVCRHKGLQIGMIISAISTMYRPGPQEVEWGIESHIGISADLLAGLMKSSERLINIISVDRLVKRVLAR